MQFYQSGCENCGFLSLEGDQDRCSECTTPHFQGMISYMDPPASWTAKWTHTSEFLCSMRPTAYLRQSQILQLIHRDKYLMLLLCAAKFLPGVYALSVQAVVPPHIEEILEDNKINWHKRPT